MGFVRENVEGGWRLRAAELLRYLQRQTDDAALIRAIDCCVTSSAGRCGCSGTGRARSPNSSVPANRIEVKHV